MIDFSRDATLNPGQVKRVNVPTALRTTGILRMLSIAWLLAVCWLLSPLSSQAVQADTIYVHAGAGGTNNGTSWTNAYTKLQDALNDATSGDQIWVAKGIYYPDEGVGQANNDPLSTFQLRNNLAIYGGFAGTEVVSTTRNITANVTVLSGDLQQNDTGKDGNGIITSVPITNIVGSNAYHVVTSSGMSNTAMLDGFTITAGNAISISVQDTGGGMFNADSSPTLRNLLFSGNYAIRSGGGMFNRNSRPTLTNIDFTSNQAYDGGGMYNTASSPDLTDVTFTNNQADYDGGGMYSQDNSNPTLTHVTFASNQAPSSGGGMANFASSPALTDVTFTSNQSFRGGGMCNQDNSNPTLTHVTFMSNQGEHGGGITNFDSSPALTDVTLTGNQGGVRGGGMANFASSPALTDVTFTSNQAIYGGGMSNEDGSSPALINTIFTGNQATFGGGMSNVESSNPTLTNTIFTGNQATTFGGGLDNFDSSPGLVNVTIVGNRGHYGGGLHNWRGKPLLVNTIVWGNQATFTGTQLYNTDNITSTPTIRYSLIQGSGGSARWDTDLGTDGGHNVDFDPQFVAPVSASSAPTTTGDYHLHFESQALDAGDGISNTLLTDLDGNPRLLDTAIDLGAYERLRIAGVAVTPASLTVNEPNTTAVFRIRLTRLPSAVVTINLVSSDTSECSVAGSEVLNASNWQQGVSVTVIAVDDQLADGAQSCTIQTSASSTDADYNNIAVADVPVTVNDNDSAGITVSPVSLFVSEPSSTAIFTVALISQPTADVVINLTSSDTSECTVPASLTLTPANALTGMAVTVTGVDDLLTDGAQPCTIQTGAALSTDPAYNGMAVADVVVTVNDNDSAGITVNPVSLTVSEPSSTAVFTVALTSQPTADVAINLTSSDTSECTVPAALTLTPANALTGMAVTVTGVDDLLIDGAQPCTIQTGPASSTDPAYNGMAVADVAVTVNDDDHETPSVTMNLTSLVVNESAGTSAFRLSLNRQPTADVVINLTSSDTSVCTVPASVVLTPANALTGVAVTVTIVDDLLANGPQTCIIQTGTASSADPAYNGMTVADLTITVNDNETGPTPAVVVSPSNLTLSEPSSTANFTLMLNSQPTADVVINLTSSDPGECTVPASVVLTPANALTGVSATITAVDDLLADGPQTCIIETSVTSSNDTRYTSLAVVDVTVTVNDNDSTNSMLYLPIVLR